MSSQVITRDILNDAIAGNPAAARTVFDAIRRVCRYATATSPTIDADEIVGDVWIELANTSGDPAKILPSIARTILNRRRTADQHGGIFSETALRSGTAFATATVAEAANAGVTARYLVATGRRPVVIDEANATEVAADVPADDDTTTAPITQATVSALVQYGWTTDQASRFVETILDALVDALDHQVDASPARRRAVDVVTWAATHGPEDSRAAYQAVLDRDAAEAPRVRGSVADRALDRTTQPRARKAGAAMARVTEEEWSAGVRYVVAVAERAGGTGYRPRGRTEREALALLDHRTSDVLFDVA